MAANTAKHKRIDSMIEGQELDKKHDVVATS
jgi:hypothetical protein